MAKLARGDLGLATEITLFLAKLTPFTAPLTIKWLLGVPRVELRDIVLWLTLAAGDSEERTVAPQPTVQVTAIGKMADFQVRLHIAPHPPDGRRRAHA
jgi:hypothetical protein